ncbi:hypothetical protein [Planktotalea arctica]|uniref:hypothetical protein n=1 Tax=Planktotalea arctica TaxID=1481893 RepID=UPI00321B4C1B
MQRSFNALPAKSVNTSKIMHPEMSFTSRTYPEPHVETVISTRALLMVLAVAGSVLWLVVIKAVMALFA